MQIVIFIPSGEIVRVSDRGIRNINQKDSILLIKNSNMNNRLDLVKMVWDFNDKVWYILDNKKKLFHNRVIDY